MILMTNLKNGHLIELNSITKIYGKGRGAVSALRGVNMHIETGEFVSVMGPSGSGKSTCMNILGCLDVPTSGMYRFKGVDVATLTRNQRALVRRHFLGFVFQGFNLLNRTSALENIELPLIYRGISSKERRVRAMEAIETVGLKGWESHTPSELSGGQQQRIAIARAMVIQPDVLMADEPTGNLDSQTSKEIMSLLHQYNQEQKLTIVMVTHDAEMAAYSERVIQFLDGQICNDEVNGDRVS